ncbi:MAG TPA: hypothetical protein VFA61_01770 [Candidatus Udaeobacter sp.]|nr:hypothetical protein [Candidatus Udaeobacter sp.]
MKPKLSPSTERQILKLEKRAFKLERELAGVNAKWKKKIESLQAKHEKDITKLKAENAELKKNPIVCDEETRQRLIAQRERLLSGKA